MRIASPQRRADKAFYVRQILIPLLTTSGLALFICLFFGLATRRKSPTSLNVSCDANSNVRIEYDSGASRVVAGNKYWNPNFFLGITMGFGRFSFSTVRIIDGLWDVIIARCGQAILGLVAYPVLRRSLGVELEMSTASLSTFSSMAFDKISVSSAWKVVRDSASIVSPGESTALGEGKDSAATPGRKKRCIWRYLGWISVLTYLLAFPTMTAITTGYQPRYEPYLTPPNTDVLIPMSPFKIPQVILEDGSDIGLPGVTALDFSHVDPGLYNLTLYYQTCDVPVHSPPENATYPRIETCPEEACNCTISLMPPLWDGDTFERPNITSSNLTLNGRTWTLDGGLTFSKQCGAGKTEGYCLDYGNVYLTDGNYTLDQYYLQDHGFCRPLNMFRWGFSSLALFTHLLITLTVAAILTALHFDALRKGHTDKFDSNLYSDAVVVSHELEKLGIDRPLGYVPAPELKGMVEAKQAQIHTHNHGVPRSRR